jgi:hypothetical protein
MNTAMKNYDPLVSEFQSPEQEKSYDAWLQAKVKSSLADSRPHIPHDEVMAKMDALLTNLVQKAA